MSAGEVNLERMTRKEAREALEAGRFQTAIVPTGSIEQHLEHLAMIHDIQSSRMIAEDVARRLYPRVLVTTPLFAGISEHHMAFRFGSVTMKPGTFHAVLWDTVDSLVRHGIRNILILNGHGGNVAPMAGSINQFRRYFGVNLHFKSYWDFTPPEVAESVLETRSVPGHAQEFETSLALYMFPENVRVAEQQASEDEGVRLASAEKGRRLYEAILPPLVEYVRRMTEGTNRAEIDGL
jgi:creatinine amidohydrolase